MDQDDKNVLLELIKNGDTKALSSIDAACSDRMAEIRQKISEAFLKKFTIKNDIKKEVNLHLDKNGRPSCAPRLTNC